MNSQTTLSAGSGPSELRRDRRFVAPALALEIEGRQLTSINWSLGGFLVRGELPLDIGDRVAGTLHAAGSDGFAFIARLVRREKRGRGLGFAFEDMMPLIFSRAGDRPGLERQL